MEGILAGAAGRLAGKAITHLGEAIGPIAIRLSERALTVLEAAVAFLIAAAERLSVQVLSKDPKVQAAGLEMFRALVAALRIDYVVAGSVVVVGCILPLLIVLMILLYKAWVRPRLSVFVSFNRAWEVASEDLERSLATAGTKVVRIPFQEENTHDVVVDRVATGIRQCDSFVCLPGYDESYVDHEVMAAKTSEKPLVFVVSEAAGTLPNTADKRYPVFRLETACEEQFRSLIAFLDYVGADLRSTRKLCRRSLLHPYVQAASQVILLAALVCLVSLWFYCYYRIQTVAPDLAASGFPPALVEQPIRQAHFLLLGIAASAAFFSFLYTSMFCVSLALQFKARRKVRLRTIAAQFNRDDWIGVVPDLTPGRQMYECLFAAAPLAHHERKKVLAAAG